MSIHKYKFSDVKIITVADIGNGTAIHVIHKSVTNGHITYSKADVIALAKHFKLTANDLIGDR